MKRFLDGFKDVEVQPFMPDGPVVTLDISILLGLPGLDVVEGDALCFSAQTISVELMYSGPSPMVLEPCMDGSCVARGIVIFNNWSGAAVYSASELRFSRVP